VPLLLHVPASAATVPPPVTPAPSPVIAAGKQQLCRMHMIPPTSITTISMRSRESLPAVAATAVAMVAAAAVVGPRPLKANSRKQRWLHPPQAAVRVCQVVTQGDVSYTSQSCQQLASKRRKQHCTIADLGQLPPCKGIGCESQGPCHTPTLLARPATVFLHMCLQPLTLWACSAWAAHAAAILDSTTHQQNQRCS